MKEQDNQDLLVENVDANAVDALSAELLETVSVEGASEEQLEELLDDKKKEEEEQEGVLAKIAEEGVEVAAADGGAIDLAEIDTNEQGGSAAGSGGSAAINPAVAVGLGVAGVVGVAAAADDGGSSGGGKKEDNPDDFNTNGQKFEMSVSSPTVAEGDSGTKVLTFTLTLDKAPTSAVDFSVAVTGGTANDDDFVASAGKVSFVAGQTSATYSVTVSGDQDFEADETVEVTFSGKNLKDPVVATGTIANDDADPTPSTPEVFTLTEAFTAPETIAVEPITKTITFIGFNPHAHGETGVDNTDGNNASDAFPDEDANAQGNDNNLTNENPFDGGIPLYDLDANYNPVLPGAYGDTVVQKGLMSYITDLTGLDFVQLGLINVANGEESGNGGVDDNFPDLSDITLNNNGDGTQTITVVLSDGTENTAEVQISDQYFTLLTNLLFDSENNLRLYEQEITFYPQVPVTVDGVTFYQNLYSYTDGGGVEMPIVLTPSQNNGGTEESGLTSDSDNLIVAGRLDLLHGAYIDGGAGNNTLEIDAKGFYAQPKELLNIQTVSIENLPNVYTNGPDTGLGDGSDDSTYPDLDESYTDRYTNSIIDLSRAGDLESLVVSESNFQGLDGDGQDFIAEAGDLTVAGIRGGATLTLDGAFSNNDYAFHFRETSSEGVNVVLHNVNFDDGDLILAHNSPVLNVASTGAGNVIEGSDLSGDGPNSSNLTTLNITGEASLLISDSIADAFAEGTPAVIDASGNTGGVDLKMNGFDDEVTFIGTAAADDHFEAHLDDGRSVTITGGAGNGEYDVSTDGDVVVTAGDGNNEIWAESYDDDSTGAELEGTVNVTVGEGQNDITVYSTDAFAITAGNGDNRIEAFGGDDDEFSIFDRAVTEDDLSTIVLGDGQNEVSAYSRLLSVEAGNGGNEIEVFAYELELTSGTGNDVIVAGSEAGEGGTAVVRVSDGDNDITIYEFDNVDVVTGGGDDALTIIGGNINFGIGGEEVEVGSEEGTETLINVDLGLGNNTLTLGSDGDDLQGVTAVDGSTITGSNLTLVVNRDSDLSRAELSGVTAIQMRGDEELGDDDASVLTLSVSQFLEIGGSAAVSTIGQSFGAHSVINLVVDQDVSLDDLNVDALPRSIDFSFEVMDGVTLEMTAQQLHERVTNQGVTAFVDGNGDFAEGTVLITGGAPNFNENDTMEGGSIHPLGANTLNVRVSETVNGYERPGDVTYFTRININTDTDLDGGVLNPFTTDNTFLRITGNSGLMFVPVEAGLDEWGQPIPNAGDSIELAVGSDGPFLIDYSTVGGDVEGLVIDHFEKALVDLGPSTGPSQWMGGIYGNGIDARLDVKLDGDVGSDEQGLISAGVQTFVVVDMYGDDHTFWTCETTEDLEVLGLRGNYEDTLTLGNVERGVEFLMEVEYVKDAGYVVGAIFGDFARPGADAVVNVVGLNDLPDGETQMVAGIQLVNTETAVVNVTGGDTRIEMFNSSNNGVGTESLTVTADADLFFPELRDDLGSFDGSGVAGTLTTSVDPGNSDTGLDFEGAAGGTNLSIDNAGVDAIDSIGGAGPVALTIGDGTGTDTVNLSETELSNVTSVTIVGVDTDPGTPVIPSATLVLTMEQADDIGAENFVVAEGDAGGLKLVGLSDQEFSLANYDVEGELVIDLTLASDPVVTLHPNTDLTGIGGLEIPEGTTLYLTMAQFQQLDDEGTLTGMGSVVITDTTQADVGVEGIDLDLSMVNLTGTDSTVTVMLAEDVDLSDSVLMDVSGDPIVDAFIYGDDTSLTLGDIQNADGVDITGGANSTLVFTDTQTNIFETIDASGFDISFLYYTNTITNGGNRNIDDIFAGLAGDIEKFSYFGEGFVLAIDQVANIEETVTVEGSLVFNPSAPDTELNSLTFNMQGGAELNGNLRVSTGDKFDDDNGNGIQDAGEADLVRTYLRELTINSNGAADVENLLSGVAANVISGDITGEPGFPSPTNQINNLLNVTINAEQNFILEGQLVFSSNVGGDDFASNDIEDATATLNVNGDADVTLADLDTDDNDVDALVINHTGSGTLTVGLSSLATVDAGDLITFNGSATGMDIINISGTLDLSDDVLNDVDTLVLDESGGLAGSNDVSLTITQAQFDAIGAANIIVNTDGQTSYLNINEFGAAPFDATTISEDIDDIDLFMADGNITLDPATNLTGVDTITVPEGGVLNLTAAQFLQLQGSGTIVGVDEDGNPTSDYSVNITGLTQADIDNGPLDLSDITADNVTLSLAESVELSDDDVLDLDGASSGEVEVLLTDGQDLGIALFSQADGLNVTGTGDTDVFFRFADEDGSPVTFFTSLDASGYSVTQLHALNVFAGGFNVEFLLDDLSGAIDLVIYHDPEELGLLNTTNRVVIVEEGVSVGNNTIALAFNDLDAGDEVITLTMNLMGGVELNGDIVIGGQTPPPNTMPLWLQNVTIVSEGDGSVPNLLTGETNNIFDGDLTPFPAGASPGLENNNLLDVDVIANLAFEMTGQILLNRRTTDDDDDATVSFSGPAAVTIKGIDTSGSDTVIDTLTVSNTGGPLTITAGSDALQLDGTENLVFTGDGDILLDTDTTMAVTDNGVDGGDELSNIDASAFSGDLTLNVVENIDSANFSFTAGSGVTTATFTDGDLDSTGPGEDGWSFDYSNAAAGSELHLAGAIDVDGLDPAAGSELSINMGPNGVLYIDSSMDLSGLDLEILGAQSIVLADEVELTLTASQADGLNIIAGADTGAPGYTGVVNIVGLTNDADPDDPSDAFDLSGISSDVAGTIFLADDDVTLDKATDLGAFSITLEDLAGDSSSRAGQTIRFQNVDQAEREIVVDPDTGAAGTSSTNVVWLFTNDLGGTPVNTDDYSSALGRLFLLADFIDANGGDVEDTFTTLPNTILRVPADDLNEVNVLLQSNAINRIMEIEHFETVGNLIFDDSGISPVEHIESVTLMLGGQATVGNIVVDDVFGANVDPNSVSFNGVTIESYRAVTTGDALANEDFVNDNDGVNEEVSPGVNENVQPNNINTVGNIGVGGNAAEIDLLTVTLDTGDVTVIGDSSAGEGADLTVGDIVFDSEVPASLATLVLEGANKITAGTIDWSDADITAFLMDVGSFTGVFDPVLDAGATGETFTIEDVGGSAGVGTIIYDDVTGAELSVIDGSGSDENVTMTISQIDSNDDGTDDAFTYTATSGVNDITLAGATLEAGSTWTFDLTNAAYGSTVTIDAGTTLQPGSTLNVDLTYGGYADPAVAAQLVIDDSVDLTGVDLNVTGGVINVTAGNSLTLTVEQLADLFASSTPIIGEGTVVVIGDGTDADPDIFSVILAQSADLSAVTIDTDGLNGDDDVTGALEITGASSLPSLDIPFSELTFIADDADNADEEITISYSVDGVPAAPVVIDLSGIDVMDAEAIAAEVASVLDGMVGLVAFAEGEVVRFVASPAIGIEFEVTDVSVTAGTATTLAADIVNSGAVLDQGGIQWTGSAENDVIEGGNEDDVFSMGAGDDTITGNGGSDTFNVDEGTDTIIDLNGDADDLDPLTEEENDVLVVSTGATALASTGGFVATADTINNGAATITADGASDEAVIAVTADGADDDSETITLDVEIVGDSSFPGTVVTLGAGVDVTDAAAVATAIASTLDTIAGITASSTGAIVNASSDSGAPLTIDVTIGGTTTTLAADVGYNVTVDMSQASGPNGYTVVGAGLGASSLSGSAFGDVISDGDDVVLGSNTVDVLTGNAGGDTFAFTVNVSNTAVFAEATVTPAIDREVITITGDGANDTDETLAIDYTLNGVAQTTLTLDFDALGVDPTDAAAVAAAAIAALDARAGISATTGTNPEDIVVSGDNGGDLTIDAVTPGGTTTTLAGAIADGADQAQETTLTVTGTPTAGDVYSILAPGEVPAADYTAMPGDDADAVAAGLAAAFNAAAPATTIDATVVDNVITFADEEDDNGGFTLTLDSTAAFGGSSATGDINNFDELDIVTDFSSGADSISMGLVAGTGNYAEAAEVADYATALANANTAFDGSVTYYLTSATDLDGVGGTGLVEGQEGAGILFADANLDGTADVAILLLNVTSDDFLATDIVV
ncbi:hypothetical protein I6N98_17395 [Spongiibacter nanhainus]|uniref:Calx-beta domain-containing protein n=1 Tax=Spongiibacter nanhainus TaxID=2794344 RepID=A0A7T4R0K4_9GAMM|nr:hypothetical protein [Spongiibacter nanhainus]QQD18089.1 hypothetical protein I6N98_17395 [Spongiibacter nanhainus]